MKIQTEPFRKVSDGTAAEICAVTRSTARAVAPPLAAPLLAVAGLTALGFGPYVALAVGTTLAVALLSAVLGTG